MIDPKRNLAVALAAFTLLPAALTLTALSGCEDPPPPPPPPAPKPPPPAEKTPAEVAEVLNLDPKMNVAFGTQAGCEEGEIKAALQFASDFAAGDDRTLRLRMDPMGKGVLEELVSSGTWASEVANLDEVRFLSCVDGPEGILTSFELHMNGGQVVPQAWTITQRGDTYVFSPFAPKPEIKIETPAETPEGEDGEEEDGDNNNDDGEDDRIRNRDPRRRVPRPNNPGAPGG